MYPVPLSFCSVCHAGGGAAAGTSYVLGKDDANDHGTVAELVTAGDPDGSLLLQKASGATSHGGSAVLDANSIEFQILQAWVEQGAAQ